MTQLRIENKRCFYEPTRHRYRFFKNTLASLHFTSKMVPIYIHVPGEFRAGTSWKALGTIPNTARFYYGKYIFLPLHFLLLLQHSNFVFISHITIWSSMYWEIRRKCFIKFWYLLKCSHLKKQTNLRINSKNLGY